jgi:hypothetical protein
MSFAIAHRTGLANNNIFGLINVGSGSALRPKFKTVSSGLEVSANEVFFFGGFRNPGGDVVQATLTWGGS